MKIEANAKINLTLDVVKKREDGYHELDMIMVPLSLCDVLDVSIALKDEIICGVEHFPLDESNTIYKAIKLMRERFHLKECFKVIVHKKIPMQAGLAGGSADGAAMLKAIIQLCNLTIEEKELLMIAKQIGADVPFCVVNEASRVQGIGEKVSRFKINCPFYLLLVKPEAGVSTGLAFSKIDFSNCVHPNVDKAQYALSTNDYSLFCECIGNTLEQSAFQITPIVKTIKEELIAYGMDSVLMSGSGSSVFAITRDKQLMDQVEKEMKKKYPFVSQCEILSS
ncbi:MAG: 4-(cytidine 5'-diphospho)-2-C-methyl-D-erythritol kinase [Erysipelotrichia bacterium]|nr:4-(cytidine 5'-diphospho)-2-C-methyl-D-erythritol kinase [Erysipelotrichia bacterium]NCC55444.1 4-(cytidine 5'-diphospho)-2-C-methyl-D-erythritol kinase [Erysipelotrichia bacterium]